MNRSVVGWIVAFALAFAGSVLAWLWFAGGSGEPSTELTTPALAGVATTEAVGTTRTFVIDEGLQGSPNRVFGQTDQVAGQILVDLADPSAIQPGEVFSFSLTGDLTIKGFTNEATFDVSAAPFDGSTIEGSVTTTVLRSDFGIGIPSVPGVADVGDEVVLNLSFVAVAG